MSFNSTTYLAFLAAVFIVWRVVSPRRRWVVLLAASFAFYSWLLAPHLLVALGIVTAISWRAGIAMAAPASQGRRKGVFWAAVTAILIVLIASKYLSTLCEAFGALRARLDLPGAPVECGAIVTIGVSYYAFQAISYLADVFLEVQEPERRFGRYALYMAFFPKLLQGPIERARDLLPQLEENPGFDYGNVRAGLLRFGWGLFQKAVIADRLAAHVDPVYQQVQGHAGPVLLVATYLYALQIFYDFAGYTDMALGSARIFGIRLTQNFDRPYLASSIAEFWRRWHISFSRWLFDYVFRPLQFRWRNALHGGTALALVVTFLLSGAWHGTRLGFMVWGLLHGIYLAAWLFLQPREKRLRQRIGPRGARWLERGEVLITFHLVCFAWIFFRADTLGDAWYVATNLFVQGPAPVGLGLFEVAVAAMTFIPLLVPKGRALPSVDEILRLPVWARWTVYYGLIIGVLLFRAPDAHTQFVYFKF